MNVKVQQIQRRSFECWRIYGKRKSSRRRAMHKAIYLYNVRLKQKVINSLLRLCIEAKKTRCFYENLPIESKSKESATKPETWAVFNHNRILKNAFRAWLEYSKNRRRIKDLNTGVCDLCNKLYLIHYIEIWRTNCLEKRRNFQLDEKVNKLYRKFLQRKVLRLWIERHNDKLIQTRKWENATLHSRRNLLKKIWFAWIKYCNVKIEKANKITNACYFFERQLLRKSFNKLASNVTKRIAERWMIERATNHYEKILLRRISRGWIDYHRHAIDIGRKIEIYCKRVENRTKEKILWQLRLYVWKKKCSRRRNYNSTNHYTRKLKAKTILVLKKYLLYRKEKAISLIYLSEAIRKISHEMQKMYINRWRIAVIFHAQMRQKFRRVEDHASARLMKHYFSMWKIYSEQYKVKAERKRKLREIGESVLLDKYMNLWIQKYAVAAKIREKEKHAIIYFEEKLKTRFFNYWMRYIEEKIINKIEEEEAKSFNRKNLLREGSKKAPKISLHNSKSQCENRLDCLPAKTNNFKDFDIMRKFFSKWWRAVDQAKERRNFRSFNTRIKHRNDVYEIPYATNLPHRFVLPEYMIKNPSSFYGASGFYQRDHFLSRKTQLSSPSEISTSGSYDSDDSISGTYNIIEQDVST